MLKPLNNEKVVVSVSFRQQIRTISNSKVLEIDLEVVEKFDDFVVFDAISVQFPKVLFISSITLNNERTSYAILFLEENVAAFCFKNTNNFCFQHHRFQATHVYILKRFGFRTMAKVQQGLNAYFSRPLEKHLQTSVQKWLTLDRKKSKKSEFC